MPYHARAHLARHSPAHVTASQRARRASSAFVAAAGVVGVFRSAARFAERPTPARRRNRYARALDRGRSAWAADVAGVTGRCHVWSNSVPMPRAAERMLSAAKKPAT